MGCKHPPESCTWEHKEPGGVVTIIDGMIHAICDLCGTRLFLHVEPGYLRAQPISRDGGTS